MWAFLMFVACVDTKFGIRQGVRINLVDAASTETPHCAPPLLPDVSGCHFNHETDRVFLPQRITSSGAQLVPSKWQMDAKKLIRQIKELQFPQDCGARTWSVIRTPLYGVGYSVLNFLFKAAGLWRSGISVFNPPGDTFPWAEKDRALPCSKMFGCYFEAFQGCQPHQLNRRTTTAVLWKWQRPDKVGVDVTCTDMGLPPTDVLNLTSGECGQAFARRGYIKPRKIPDTVYYHALWLQNFTTPGWFEQKWGGLVYESILLQYIWRHPPKYRAVLDTYVARLGMPKRCIAMHVRHGDACATKWRKCSELSVYMSHAETMRQRYGLDSIYVMTDDPKIMSDESLLRYRSRFKFFSQPVNRNVFEGADKNTWVERKLDNLGNELLHSVLKDVHAASRCTAFIGGFDGQLSKVVLGLMTSRLGVVPPYVSVDQPYCRKFKYVGPCAPSGKSALAQLARLQARDKDADPSIFNSFA